MKIKISGILFLLLFNGCKSENTPRDFDYGRIENHKYVNSYFDCEITLPVNWIVQTKDQMDSFTKKANDSFAGDNPKMKAVLKASEINSAHLLSVNQFEEGSAVDYNPSIILVAENIKSLPGMKVGSDYLFQARKLLEQSSIKYDSIDKEFTKQSINGTDFYKMNAEIEYMGQNLKQTYYSTIIKGFSFNIIISYIDEKQKNEMLKTINSVKFLK